MSCIGYTLPVSKLLFCPVKRPVLQLLLLLQQLLLQLFLLLLLRKG
jgi:hypothetical protein